MWGRMTLRPGTSPHQPHGTINSTHCPLQASTKGSGPIILSSRTRKTEILHPHT